MWILAFLPSRAFWQLSAALGVSRLQPARRTDAAQGGVGEQLGAGGRHVITTVRPAALEKSPKGHPTVPEVTARAVQFSTELLRGVTKMPSGPRRISTGGKAVPCLESQRRRMQRMVRNAARLSLPVVCLQLFTCKSEDAL